MNRLLNRYLTEYIENPRSAVANFNVGLEYMHLGQRAAAITYFNRASELAEDKDLVYTCLLLNYDNLNTQLGRSDLTKGQLLHAIRVLPHRAEAYYLLSLHHQAEQEWQESYTAAAIAEANDTGKVYADVGYPGSYGPILQRAVTGYYLGYERECRELCRELILSYKMQEEHYQLVQNRLLSLGAGPVSVAITTYDKSKYLELVHKFPGSDKIERNYSQVYQDMFVLTALNGKRDGLYIEVGGGDPYHGNNTALLELNYGWKGRSLEFQETLADKYNKARANGTECLDATQVNYTDFITGLTDKTDIDYLQLDCEPSETTYRIMESIPFDTYRFAVITYEHDHYVDGTQLYRQKSRDFLKSKGYELVVGDIGPTDWYSFEDWWVHPDLVDRETIEKLKYFRTPAVKAEDYMLGRL
jgi:tetratricopeptide (TPR) repeat protein